MLFMKEDSRDILSKHFHLWNGNAGIHLTSSIRNGADNLMSSERFSSSKHCWRNVINPLQFSESIFRLKLPRSCLILKLLLTDNLDFEAIVNKRDARSYVCASKMASMSHSVPMLAAAALRY